MLKSCGFYIKRLRQSTGLTQEELAEKLSVNSKIVSAWEQDRLGVSNESLQEILDCFKLSWEEFYSDSSSDDNCMNIRIMVCNICGKPIISFADMKAVCCGLEVNPSEYGFDEKNKYSIRKENGNIYFSVEHVMEKDHHVSFIIYLYKKGYDTAILSYDDKPEAVFADKGEGEFIINCTRLGLQKYKYK